MELAREGELNQFFKVGSPSPKSLVKHILLAFSVDSFCSPKTVGNFCANLVNISLLQLSQGGISVKQTPQYMTVHKMTMKQLCLSI